MTRQRDRYHQAARDNYLDLLREATSSDCDAPDDGGMTPVMWAAFYGHLEALRVLMGRGGNPDRADSMGSTALHFAALNGHMNCVTYLVHFGANIWALDVDFHSALDLAGLREHRNIVDFLDGVVSREAERNQRTVAKQRERAALDAQRRAKKLERLMRKADKQQQQQQQQLTLSRAANATNPNYRHSLAASRLLSGSGASTYGSIDGAASDCSIVFERAGGRTYSDHVGSATLASTASASSAGGGGSGGGTRARLPRTAMAADVIYATTSSGVSAAASLSPTPASPHQSAGGGLFERPGFGNVAFLKPPQQLGSAPSTTGVAADIDNDVSASPKSPDVSPMIFAAEAAAAGPTADDFADGDAGESPELATFLACLGLADFHKALAAERLDLDALALCDDADLRDLGLPLGPRLRIMEALERRREALGSRQALADVRF